MKLEWFIAIRYLMRRRKSGFISVISLISIMGVTVGVMALIVVMAVMSGFDRELKAKIVGVHPHIIIQKIGGIEGGEALIEKIKAMHLPKLKTISSYVNGQGLIRSDRNAQGVLVKGIGSKEEVAYLNDYMKYGEVAWEVDASKYIIDKDAEISGGILLGGNLARQLGVGVGDVVQLISPHLEKKLLKTTAHTEDFIVTGIYHVGMHEVDSNLAMIGVDQARSLYNLDNRVTGISIKLDDVYWAPRVQEQLLEELGYEYWVQTWIDMNRNFFAALKVEKRVMSILLFLIILVAAFNIVSTLIMVVMEKSKDIAIMIALGATSGSIQRIFILKGIVVGVFGTALGVGSGLAFATRLNPIADLIKKVTGFEVFPSDIYFFDKIPAQINTIDVVGIAAFAFITTVIAGIYPAKRAASLNPVEVMRYE